MAQIIHLLLEFGETGFGLFTLQGHVFLIDDSGCRRKLVRIDVIYIRFVNRLLPLNCVLRKHIPGLAERLSDLSAEVFRRGPVDGIQDALTLGLDVGDEGNISTGYDGHQLPPIQSLEPEMLVDGLLFPNTPNC